MANQYAWMVLILIWTNSMPTKCQFGGENILLSFGRFLQDGEIQMSNEPQDKSRILKKYDFIIVGAGTAGCTLASRLTEVPEWKVLLIEAGGHENFVMDIPLLANYLQFTEANWKYKTAPSNNSCLAMDKRQCNWPRGKVMGGSSVLNYMIYTRGNRRDFDLWRDLGNPGWGWDDVLPYFKKIERYGIPEFNDPKYHSESGYLDVQYAAYRTRIAEAWVKGGQEVGHKYADHNGATQTGVSYLQLSLSNGTRHSSNRAYLMPVKNRKNLHVIKHTMVTKLLMDGKKVIGVEILRSNKKFEIFAKKEVIVSAGAINSPQLLMLSGIGPKKHLEEMNIPVVQDLKVGYNLMDHIAAGGLTFTVNRDITFLSSFDVFTHPNKIFQWMNTRVGPLSVPGGCEAVAFIDLMNKKSKDGWADMELLFVGGGINSDPLLRRNFGIADDLYNTVFGPLGLRPTYMVLPMLMRPRSKGRIKLKSNNPRVYPVINPNYYAYQEDVDTMVAGMKEAIKIAETPAMKAIGTKLYDRPIPACAQYGFGSDKYWECHAKHFTFTIYHASGTCKMGPRSDPTAVIDSRLRVHGIQGVRVADVSIMPEITSGHPNSPVYMIAEKAADMIKEDWGIPIKTV